MSNTEHERTIIHFDIDCFYAQVEMIRNPNYRDKPLGIQQKNIMVTCNYEARKRGLTKLMYISEAHKKCPDLIIANGEDLTHYRNMSYRISDFIQKYTPLVERLGFDENFADVTSMVEDRIKKGNFKREFFGKVYGSETALFSQSIHSTDTNITSTNGYGDVDDNDSALVCHCGCLLRTQIGSQIAADIREALQHELQITCCAGIAHNKLLAKLVGSIHKPNQQTSILHDLGCQLVSSLPGIRSIPGIGSSSIKRLKAKGIESIWDLQQTRLSTLEEEFGKTMAKNFSQLCFGIDNTPVISYSLPQTISDEDSFKCCNGLEDFKSRVRQLTISLLRRLEEDARKPATLRLTIRGKDFIRNSRQCPVPPNVFKRSGKGEEFDIIASRLMPTLLNLFYKLVDVSQPFHLTLINVCFAKLIDPNSKQNTLYSFFTGDRGHRTNAPESNSNPIGSSVESEVEVQKFLDDKNSFDAENDPHTKILSNENRNMHAIQEGVNSSQETKEQQEVENKKVIPEPFVSSISHPTSSSHLSASESETECHAQINQNSESTACQVEKEMTQLTKPNNPSLEILKKLLPKHIDCREVLQLPEDIQSEVLMSFGINWKISEDGQKSFFLVNKVSTRSKERCQSFYADTNKVSNPNFEKSYSPRKPLFSPRKRKADRDKDLSDESTVLLKKVAFSKTDEETSTSNSNTVCRMQTFKKDYDTSLELFECDVAYDKKGSTTREKCNNEVHIGVPAASSSVSISTPSASVAESQNPTSSSGLANDTVAQNSLFSSSEDPTTILKEKLQPIEPSNSVEKLTDDDNNNACSASSEVFSNANKLIKGESLSKMSTDTSLTISEVDNQLCSTHFQNSCNVLSLSQPNHADLLQKSPSSKASSSSPFLTNSFNSLNNTDNTLMTSSKVRQCPADMDPEVFYSLPSNIQGELLAHNAMGTGSLFTRSYNHQMKAPTKSPEHHRNASKHTVAGKSNRKGESSQKDPRTSTILSVQ